MNCFKWCKINDGSSHGMIKKKILAIGCEIWPFFVATDVSGRTIQCDDEKKMLHHCSILMTLAHSSVKHWARRWSVSKGTRWGLTFTLENPRSLPRSRMAPNHIFMKSSFPLIFFLPERRSIKRRLSFVGPGTPPSIAVQFHHSPSWI